MKLLIRSVYTSLMVIKPVDQLSNLSPKLFVFTVAPASCYHRRHVRMVFYVSLSLSLWKLTSLIWTLSASVLSQIC